MTSDKASDQHSPAWENLQYALGRERVSLRALTQAELHEFVWATLANVQLREIRGFKRLAEVLPGPLDSSCVGNEGKASVMVAPDAEVKVIELNFAERFSTLNLGLDSHFIEVNRRPHLRQFVWRRNESGEETTDFQVFKEWGHAGGYLQSGHWRELLLHRPPNHTGAENNLFDTRVWFTKVPHENRYLITNIFLVKVPLEKFSDFFGDGYGFVTQELIWSLGDIHARTLLELERQTTIMREQAETFKRLSRAITE